MRLMVMGFSREMLDVLGIKPVIGRGFVAEENEPGGPAAVMVSHRFWTTHLGGERNLESADVRLSGERVRVVGVLPPGFRLFWGYEEWDADIFPAHERAPDANRTSHGYRVIARLADGVTLAQARSEMESLATAMQREYGDNTNAETVQLTLLPEMLLGQDRGTLLLLLFAGAAVLLVACANMAGMLLARGQARGREMAVRSSLGARSGRLVRQLVIEALLLSGAAAVLGSALAYVAVEVVTRTAPTVLPRIEAVAVDARVLLFAAVIAVISGLMVGMHPALKLSRTDLAATLRTARTEGPRSLQTWNLLVAGEVAASVVLLAISMLLIRSLREIVTDDVGFDATNVLTMEVTVPGGTFASDEEAAQFWQRLLGELRQIPGVAAAGAANLGPLGATSITAPLRKPENGDTWEFLGGWRVVSPDYFDALRIELLAGRGFTEADGPGAPTAAIINEAVANRLWPGENPIGKTIKSGFDRRDEWIEVVGVVREARFWQSAPGTQYELYVPFTQRPEFATSMSVLLRTDGDPLEMVAPARAALRRIRSDIPANFAPLAAQVRSTMADRRLTTGILGAFGVSALVLCMVGIYGVVSYTVERRTREIGIRLALGADPGRVGRQIQGAAMFVVSLGGIAGLLLAFYFTRLAEGLLHNVKPNDPGSLALAMLVLVLTAGLAAYIPARRSMRIDPLTSLRTD